MKRVCCLAFMVVTLALMGSCVTEATEVLVTLDTDAPVNRQMTITVTVHDARMATGAGASHTWVRDAVLGGGTLDAGFHDAGHDGGITMLGDAGTSITFPSSFAVVPVAGQPEDGTAVMIVEAQLAPANEGDLPIQFRRTARFSFTPGSTTRLPVFLSIGCGNLATGCTSVTAAQCTLSVRCEEQGQTCGGTTTAMCVNAVIMPTNANRLPDGQAITNMDATSGDVTCPVTCPGGANATGVCSAGICSVRCNANFGDCDDNPANGCEANLLTSATTCGACGHTCPSGQLCAAGVCIANCRAGQAVCGSGCVDLQSDTQNCGRCGTMCPGHASGSATCVAGVCGFQCNPNTGDCNHMLTDGCETNLETSVGNCGSCMHVCTGGAMSTPACTTGLCGITCATGRADCDRMSANGCEVDLLGDLRNCGACGTLCPTLPNASPSCMAGRCQSTCLAGYTDCDGIAANGCETHTEGDTANCGTCHHMCFFSGGPSICVAGVCQLNGCSAGFGDCDGNPANGCETDINTSVPNCGGCGAVCSPSNATAACTGGTCGYSSCNGGFGDCNANQADGCETDLQNSISSCGSCGHVCTPANASPACTGGTCGYGGCNGGFYDLDGNTMNGCECQDVGGAPSCGGATNLGTLGPGNVTSTTGNIVPAGASDWFTVTFTGRGHPRITLTGDPGGHHLEVQTACGSDATCPNEGGVGASPASDWEFVLTDAVNPNTNYLVAVPGQIWFRVYSSNAPVCANYTVSISE